MGFYSHSDGGTIQRYRSSSIQGYQCSWVVEFWKRRMAETPYTSLRMLRPESFTLQISSAFTEQLRIGVNNSACVTKGVLSSVNSQEVNLLVSSPKRVSGNSLRWNIQDCESLTETNRFKRVCELPLFRHRVSAGMNYKTRPDEDDGFGQIIPLCRVSSEPTIQSLCSNSWRNNHRTSPWSSNRENSWPIWTWSCNSTTQRLRNGHLMLWFPEERVGSWMKSTFPMLDSDPVQNYSLNVRTCDSMVRVFLSRCGARVNSWETCEERATIWYACSGDRKRCLVWLRKHKLKNGETCECIVIQPELCASVCWTFGSRQRRRRKRRRRSCKNGEPLKVNNPSICPHSARKLTLTSECLDCHMQLWNKQTTSVFANSWRRSRVILVDKHFKPICNKIRPITYSVTNRKRWFVKWAM